MFKKLNFPLKALWMPTFLVVLKLKNKGVQRNNKDKHCLNINMYVKASCLSQNTNGQQTSPL